MSHQSEHATAGTISRQDWWIAGGVFLAVCVWLWPTATQTLELSDEGYLLRLGLRVAQGELPHADFVDLYGSGAHWLTGFALWISDGEAIAVRVLLVAWKASAAASSFLIVRMLAPRSDALFAALLSAVLWSRPYWLMNAPYASLYTGPITLLALFLLLRAMKLGSGRAHLLAGVVAGAGVIFKAPLAVYSGFGMGLALIAALAIRAGTTNPLPTRNRTRALGWCLLWGVAAIALVAPLASKLDAAPYVVHLLPLHLLMLLGGAALYRAGGLGSDVVFRCVAPFASGCLVIPLATAGLYGLEGALANLFYDVVYQAVTLKDYVAPVTTASMGTAAPSFANWVLPFGAIGMLSGGLLMLGGRARKGALLALPATMAFALAATRPMPGHPSAIQRLEMLLFPIQGYELTLALAGVLLVLVPVLLTPKDSQPRSSTLRPPPGLLLTVALVQGMMFLQLFPVAGFNVYLVQAIIVPLVVVVLRPLRQVLLLEEPPPGWRHAVSVGLIFALPLFWAAPVMIRATTSPESAPHRHAFQHPGLRGIAPHVDPAHPDRYPDLASLLDHLDTIEPADAPIFVFTPENLITFASARPALLPDYEYDFFLLTMGFLPEHREAALDPAVIIETLKANPAGIVVDVREGDRTTYNSERLRQSLPELGRFIDAHYRIEARVGPYRILRSRDHRAE